MADVGLNNRGSINWSAPLIRENQIPSIPYFIVMDGRGEVTLFGRNAEDKLGLP